MTFNKLKQNTYDKKKQQERTNTNWNAVERPPCVQQYCISMINVHVNITHGN